jgi:hypothetical protein
MISSRLPGRGFIDWGWGVLFGRGLAVVLEPNPK